MADRVKRVLILVALVSGALICLWSPRLLLRAQAQLPDDTSISNISKWRPTHDLPGVRYVGSSVCAQCHILKARSQFGTPMAHALETVAECEILRTHPRLTFRNGPYTYQIVRQGERSIYTVSDGVNTISEPIRFCFGQGSVGQTYVFEHNGSLYESRVSYFQTIRGLDITIGQTRSVPTSLDDTLGRVLALDEAQSCFGCHSTAAVRGSQLQLDHLMPGVTCEGCHGPGEKHLSAVKAKNFKDLQIFNPGSLNANDLTQEFCGVCHQSFEQVMLMPGLGGLNNIRFQPYRIFNSQGHNKVDPRISCIACHDPHDNLEHDTSFYDSKCLACHLSTPAEARTPTRTAAACPRSTKQCVTCHMPKVELPEMHFKFTDHWIRVVKPNDIVPH